MNEITLESKKPLNIPIEWSYMGVYGWDIKADDFINLGYDGILYNFNPTIYKITIYFKPPMTLTRLDELLKGIGYEYE